MGRIISVFFHLLTTLLMKARIRSFRDKSFMILPSGGHFGYKRLLWFDKLLIKIFSLKV